MLFIHIITAACCLWSGFLLTRLQLNTEQRNGILGPGRRSCGVFPENVPVNPMHLKEIPKQNAQSVGSVCKNICARSNIGLGSGGMIPSPPREGRGGTGRVPEGRVSPDLTGRAGRH